MNADLIPLITNGAGDWLCGRVDSDNRFQQIVQWYHGGGDWIEWGNDLPHAIVFDAIVSRLPGRRRRHAIPASDFVVRPGAVHRGTMGPWLDWAIEHVPREIAELFDVGYEADSDEIASRMINHGVAEVAVRCELIQAALNLSALTSIPVDQVLGRRIGSDQLAQWSLDRDTVPIDVRDAIRTAMITTHSPAMFQQDWAAAEGHAVAVTVISPLTAWGWDISGYAALRRGDRETAKKRFLSGSQCSVFSDQSIRLQTHWTSAHAGKFSVAMLATAFPDVIESSEYLRMLCSDDLISRSDQVSEHWRQMAEQAIATNEPARSHEYLIRTGWDIGMRPITAYGSLLAKMTQTAEHSGQTARAAMARAHHRCLMDRYPG